MSQQKWIPQIYAANSHVGCVRGHNEDSFFAQSPLFIVADGMGGHEAGEVASEIAVETIAELVTPDTDSSQLSQAICEANRAVINGASLGLGKPGMGTTVTAAMIVDDKLTVAQVGDSRAYLLHNGRIQRITRDHSLVADLVEQGRITEEEARIHPQRSVITRALGSDPMTEPDLYILHVSEGDRLLLCSDGLSGMILDSKIEAILNQCATPQLCCDKLIDEALKAGGLDNVTVIVVDPLRKTQDNMRVDAGKSGKPKKSKRRLLPLVWALVAVLIIAGLGFGLVSYAKHSYYLVDEGGYVVVYQGIPGDVAGIKISWLQEKTDVQTSRLAPTVAARLEDGITVDSLEEANDLIANYKSEIAAADKTALSAQTTASN